MNQLPHKRRRKRRPLDKEDVAFYVHSANCKVLFEPLEVVKIQFSKFFV